MFGLSLKEDIYSGTLCKCFVKYVCLYFVRNCKVKDVNIKDAVTYVRTSVAGCGIIEKVVFLLGLDCGVQV